MRLTNEVYRGTHENVSWTATEENNGYAVWRESEEGGVLTRYLVGWHPKQARAQEEAVLCRDKEIRDGWDSSYYYKYSLQLKQPVAPGSRRSRTSPAMGAQPPSFVQTAPTGIPIMPRGSSGLPGEPVE